MSDLSPANLPPELSVEDDDVVEAIEILNAEAEERVSGFDGVGTRREARERAVSLLYEAEQRQLQPLAAVLDLQPIKPEEFAAGLVAGVSENLEEIDATITRCSTSWSLSRMPAIDRALLRLGIYELIWTEVPTGAAISEAVELAKRYSTDDSHRFVNAILDRVAGENGR